MNLWLFQINYIEFLREYNIMNGDLEDGIFEVF